MCIRIALASAFILTFAAPAFANCEQELKALEPNVVTAETGAVPNKSGIPATKHQAEVLAGKQLGGNTEVTGSTAGAVKPTTPHQEQVTGSRGAQSAEHPSELMAEARKMSQAGDEQGCTRKLAELKDALGVK
ncbi:MAG: hypothetical protein E5X74_20535 [Mesorhizobium sp.]|uniref:hypothetical protein n=1 Tax=Mesorhizobium sp. TaxID=1871066 RepID=UPI000FE751E9|nr:hypothetical protein [Mesorhizobium sp.]RWM25569.1 MAG: hypothetical protein EOR74_18605 [Mesorhizobium sp.]TIO75322.1 MAG: hypothetical protein E5X75_19860 [Mesorhizobium sp.]TIO83351.1 MAG: hypothetical protein E5X74_20535 [Mesorhizobium sp.]